MTGLASRLRRRLDRVRDGQDRGLSMIELVVGMGVMVVFMAIFTGAVLTMFSAANKVSALNNTASQLNIAFSRLDKQVRYAAAISPEGQSGGAWYVEFLTTNTGANVCTQLKLSPDTQLLQERTWTIPATGSSVASAWSQLANDITNGSQGPTSTDRPFQFVTSHGSARYEQLKIRLFASDPNNNTTTTTLTSVTFTALNSTVATPTTGVCTQVSRS